MSKQEIAQVYRGYLDDISDIRYRPPYAHEKGVLHGLGIALGYDYETVERDIRRARGRDYDPMQGQIRLAM